MYRSRLLLLGLLLTSPPTFGQASTNDAQTLQALLAEVRQLRQDLRTATAISQRVQIILHRLQGQEATVARMERRVDDVRTSLTQVQFEMKRLAAEIKLREDTQSNTQNPAERRDVEEVLPRNKVELESLKSTEQQLQTRQSEAEQDLRTEQARLTALQGQLDILDKSLESPKR